MFLTRFSRLLPKDRVSLAFRRIQPTYFPQGQIYYRYYCTNEKNPEPEIKNSENKEQNTKPPLDDRLRREIEWEENYKKEKEEREKKRKERQAIYDMIQWSLLALAGLGIGLLYYQGTLFTYAKELDAKFESSFFKLNNPTLGWKYKLLPPSTETHYTVVIDLEDLIFIDWGRDGKKVAKIRPYAELFLHELSEICEVVVWASKNDFMIPEFFQQLQRVAPIHFCLGYSECTNQYGHSIKDLNRLNRPLNSVVHIVHDPFHAAYQPENAFYILRWNGTDPEETVLLDTFVCLQGILVNFDPDDLDVRTFLEMAYVNKDALEETRKESMRERVIQQHEGKRNLLA